MNHLQRKQFLEILEKYQAGNASQEEVDFLDAYYEVFDIRANFTSRLKEEKRFLLKSDLKRSIDENISSYEKADANSGKRIVWKLSISAAVVLICVGLGFFYYPIKNNSHQIAGHPIHQQDIVTPREETTQKVDILPGGSKAVLTLANGQKISLKDADNGMLAEQSNVKITKIADGQLVYSISPNQQQSINGLDQYNTIETPKGGRYRLQLPDGTKVWLNSASKLTYPSSFSSHKNRKVELQGEAYFEVAKDNTRPFLVKTIMQEVEVLGTHFNISSYEDEPAVKTTLLEGSVKVTGLNGNDKILKPGQQSILTVNNITVEDIKASQDVIAWKEDQFVFESNDIQYVMRMIARWYNVEVEYIGEIPDNKFGGAISKFENISEVLKSLESTGRVKFKIEGRRVLVYK